MRSQALMGALLGLMALVGCGAATDDFFDARGAAGTAAGQSAQLGGAGSSTTGGRAAEAGHAGAARTPIAAGAGGSSAGAELGGSAGQSIETGNGGIGGKTQAGMSGSAGQAGMSGSAGHVESTEGSCPGLPAVTDYAAPGPFDTKVVPNTGPDGTYFLFRPDATLGQGGFKHPVAVWGDGILTTPDQYQTLLGHIASHGIVVIACPSTQAERPCLDAGMQWLVEQNDVDGPLKGKLDTSKELAIGYSWGGGAAIDVANRPHVKATISIHGMPPREADAWTAMKSPLLLFTSTGDNFVTAKEYVTPNFESSLVPTFYATLDEPVGHLYPLDETAVSCVASLALGGPCAGAVEEQAPIIAWIRLWACDDSAAKRYFFGPDCSLCKSPWIARVKPPDAW